jgi:PD-(D/E)XK nuclease superfamily protein
MLPSDQKGAVAELAIATAAADLGIGVWSAFTVERYDLIFDLRPGLVRVQCKWASRRDDVIVVRCSRNRRNRDGLLRQYYSADDIDAYAAYCRESRRCYFLPIDEFENRIAIQLRPRSDEESRRSESTGRGTMNSPLDLAVAGP